jgi:hypothetical protein
MFVIGKMAMNFQRNGKSNKLCNHSLMEIPEVNKLLFVSTYELPFQEQYPIIDWNTDVFHYAQLIDPNLASYLKQNSDDLPGKLTCINGTRFIVAIV